MTKNKTSTETAVLHLMLCMSKKMDSTLLIKAVLSIIFILRMYEINVYIEIFQRSGEDLDHLAAKASDISCRSYKSPKEPKAK